jgi:hypothetical protein
VQIEKGWTVNDATFYMHADATPSIRKLGTTDASNCKFTRLLNMGYQFPSISLGGDNGSAFTNCTFEYGAKSTDSGIVNIDTGAAITFTNCTFQHTTQFGTRINRSEANVQGSGNIFSDCTKGNVLLYNGQTSTTLP